MKLREMQIEIVQTIDCACIKIKKKLAYIKRAKWKTPRRNE